MRTIFILFSLFLLVMGCQKSKPVAKIESVPAVVDQIILTNGGTIQGKVVSETDTMIRIEMEGGVVGFHPSEIESIERGVRKAGAAGEESGDIYVPSFHPETKGAWPAGADDRVLMKNGEWVYGRIAKKTDQIFTVRQQIEGGGAVEHDFDLSRIEKIELWPPSEDDPERLASFQTQYPSLERMQKGYYTILSSEQDPADLNFYVKRLDQFYHDFLFHFFDIIDTNRPQEPLDIIVFGTREEFEAVLREIGYNEKSNLVGFYHFNAKKLVFYNVKTEAFIQQGLQTTRELQSLVERLGSEAAQSGTSSARGISGGVFDLAKDELGREELRILGEATAEVANIIRHEGGHQLFHLLGVTPPEVYAGGWLIEGLATYCETDPIGGAHEYKLMELRYELEQHDLMPLEYLLNFAQGMGLHKLDPAYARLAYAQSWAFIHFLMHKGYREGFFNFLREYRTQGAEYDSGAEKKLLEKYLGKDLKAIEAEFSPYVKGVIKRTVDEKIYDEYRLRLVTAN